MLPWISCISLSPPSLSLSQEIWSAQFSRCQTTGSCSQNLKSSHEGAKPSFMFVFYVLYLYILGDGNDSQLQLCQSFPFATIHTTHTYRVESSIDSLDSTLVFISCANDVRPSCVNETMITLRQDRAAWTTSTGGMLERKFSAHSFKQNIPKHNNYSRTHIFCDSPCVK